MQRLYKHGVIKSDHIMQIRNLLPALLVPWIEGKGFTGKK